MDGILNITSDKAVGLGWDFTYINRQDSRIWMKLYIYISWQTRQWDYDNLMQINNIPAKTEGFIKQDSGIWKGLFIS